MKKLFLTLSSGIALCFAQATSAQVVFQPGPAIGKDVHIWSLDNNCIPAGMSTTPANVNFADSAELPALDWTWVAGGCQSGTMRSMIAFTQLATIPPGSTILSATLDLYGAPSSTFISQGNNNYPGSLYTNTNPTQLHVITAAWNESTVTWNTAPTFSSTPLLTIPASTSQWNYNYSNSSAALVAQVQNWVNNPSTNHGFMMRLATEVNYRSMFFCSSDHPDPKLRPRLTVKYVSPCNANFSFCSSTTNPYQYTFTAADASGSNVWNISPSGSASPISGIGTTFTTTFAGPGTYTITLTHIMPDQQKCERKFYLCISQNAIAMVKEINPIPESTTTQGILSVAPNPVISECMVHYNASAAANVSIAIVDIYGKQVQAQQFGVTEGNNKLSLSTQNLNAGTYIIQLTDGTKTYYERIVKQ